jgi:hypothetical protein
MIKFVVCLALVLIPLSASATRELEIEKGSIDLLKSLETEKGSIDLLKSEVFSRPFTIFDMLLHSLGKEITEAAKDIQPEKNDFIPSRYGYPSGQIRYIKEASRVAVGFDITVRGMNDPWREVCKRHVNHMAQYLGVSDLGSQQASANNALASSLTEAGIRGFFQSHLGPKVSQDIPLAQFYPFLDALVVIGEFKVLTPDEKSLAYLRFCQLDIKNDRMTFFEYKY